MNSGIAWGLGDGSQLDLQLGRSLSGPGPVTWTLGGGVAIRLGRLR